MSIYGWILWAKNSEDQIHVTVDWASKKEWILSFALFMMSLILITLIYYYKPFIENGFSIDRVTVEFIILIGQTGWIYLSPPFF